MGRRLIGAVKMTKEVCYKALNQLQAYASKNGGKFEQEHEILSKLIKQHFDNPPLKFEELEAGMWVWDNKHKVYNEIYILLENFMSTKHNLVQFKHLNETTQWGDTIEFEENRFYRKQVEE